MLALSERVWHIPQLLNPEQCQQLLALAEEHGFVAAQVRAATGTRAMPQVRNNLRAQLPSPEWVNVLWQALTMHDLPSIAGRVACGLPRDLRFYQYLPQQRFKMHKDGPWQEDGLRSELTLLVYLNEDFQGGATDFRGFKVVPKTGDAVLFVHDTWHEGAVLEAGCKYVLRSDVMYS